MLILVTSINQNIFCCYTPKVVKLKLDNCNFTATVVIIIISTSYYNMLVQRGRKNGLIADEEGWNHHIDIIFGREFAVSKR
jgi:hypothetical protein